MRMLVLFGLASLAAAASNSTSAALAALNTTVHGRLHVGIPFARPCFSSYNGAPVSVDEAACSVVQSDYAQPEFRVDRFGAYMVPCFETCSSDVEDQCLLDASDPTDAAAYGGNASCDQGSVPPYYIDVRTAEDVVSAFQFARDTGAMLVVKNTGHDQKGRSSQKGAMALWVGVPNYLDGSTGKSVAKKYLEMHGLKNITSDSAFVPEGCPTGHLRYNSITTDAGVTFIEAYTYAEANNITMVGGYHETVGPSGGWVQGGGHSILSPVYGLGIDRVVQFKIVTPDGQFRVANECQNTDLFWALRGGGGGTFGVVLQSTHRVEKQLRLSVASIAFPRTETNAIPFLELVVNNSLKWAGEGWGGHIGATTLINVTPLLSLSDAKDSLKPVSDYALSQNGTAVIEELPSWYQFFDKYVLKAEAAVGAESLLGSRLIPAANFETPESRSELLGVLDNILLQGSAPYIVVAAPYLYDWPEDSTSATPAWRNSLWHLGFHLTYEWNSTIDERRAVLNGVHNVTQTFRDITPGSGAYTNEGDIYEPDHEFSFWGPNYGRLLEIKRRYDPDGLLDCWQCVGWSGSDSPRYKCYIKL